MYFDPGTGSIIIQVLVAAIASVGAFFALFRNKIKDFFHKEKSNEKKDKKNEK